MARIVLLIFIGVIVAGIASAYAYEFRLLSGMTIKGELRSFSDGTFHVDTEFGSVDIEADKLDFIIVEETDAGPTGAGKDDSAPGLCIGRQGQTQPDSVQVAPGAREAPVPPLLGRSVAPPPLGGWSVDTAGTYPGLFRGHQ